MHIKNIFLTTVLVFLGIPPLSAEDISARSSIDTPVVEPAIDTMSDEGASISDEEINERHNRPGFGGGPQTIREGIAEAVQTPTGLNAATLDETPADETLLDETTLGAPPAIISENPQSAANVMTTDSNSTQPAGREERIRSIIIFIASIILIIALLVLTLLLIREGKEFKAEAVKAEACLNDISGCTSQASHPLGDKPVMVGRVAGENSAHLDYLVIPESTVGRRHALIEYKDFGFWIRDQGSINGTFVNDKMLRTETRLKHGDKVRFHKFKFEFVMPEMGDGATDVAVNSGDGFFNISGGLEAQMPETPEAPAPEIETHGSKET